MLSPKRRNEIMSLFQQHKELTVKELCAKLYVSPATVRRYLHELEQQGVLKRSFGGAVLVEFFSDQTPLVIRSATNVARKKAICAKAARYIENGDTIFMDASSTVYYLAPHLKNFTDLTVITNSPYLCVTLSQMRIRCFCTGGRMLLDSVALVGTEAERFISGIRAHKCFFSGMGYDQVIMDSSKGERDVKISMINNASKAYFLGDTSKYQQHYPYVIAPIDRIEAVITENTP